MYFSSPTANITPAMTSVAMSRSDSRDSTTSTTYNGFTCAATSAYSALLSASPTSSWVVAHPLVRSDSNSSTGTSHASTTSSPRSSIAMRRDSSNSSWLPSPYRSCQSSFGGEPNSYLSDDDLLAPADELSLPVESIPALTPKKELTTEEQIAVLRELQDKEAAHHHHVAVAHAESKRKVVRFAGHSESSSRRSSTVKRRQTSVRRGLSHLNGPQ